MISFSPRRWKMTQKKERCLGDSPTMRMETQHRPSSYLWVQTDQIPTLFFLIFYFERLYFPKILWKLCACSHPCLIFTSHLFSFTLSFSCFLYLSLSLSLHSFICSCSFTALMQNPSDQVSQVVELRVLSNWGHVEYTCLYRFRVHGKIASAWDTSEKMSALYALEKKKWSGVCLRSNATEKNMKSWLMSLLSDSRVPVNRVCCCFHGCIQRLEIYKDYSSFSLFVLCTFD